MLRKRDVPMEVLRVSFAIIVFVPGPMSEVRRLEFPRRVEYLRLTHRAEITVRKPRRGGVCGPDALLSDCVKCVVHPVLRMHKARIQARTKKSAGRYFIVLAALGGRTPKRGQSRYFDG